MNRPRHWAPAMGRELSGRLLLLAALLAMLPFSALAQSTRDVKLLAARDAQRLSPEAQKIYKEGVAALDRIDPVKAIDLFSKVAEMSPEAVEMQYLTARLAQLRARRAFAPESTQYYEIADRALERIGQRKNPTPLEQRRLDTMKNEIGEERQRLEVRRQRRMAVGAEFQKLYAKERFSEDDEKEKKKARPRPVVRPGGPGAPGAMPPPRPAGGGGDSAS